MIRGFGSSVYLFNLNIILISSLTHQIFVLTILSVRYAHFNTFSFVSDSTAAQCEKKYQRNATIGCQTVSTTSTFYLFQVTRKELWNGSAAKAAHLQFREGSSYLRRSTADSSSYEVQLRRRRRPSIQRRQSPLTSEALKGYACPLQLLASPLKPLHASGASMPPEVIICTHDAIKPLQIICGLTAWGGLAACAAACVAAACAAASFFEMPSNRAAAPIFS